MNPPTLTSPNGATASRFAFGARQFGGKASEGNSRVMHDACREAGGKRNGCRRNPSFKFRMVEKITA